MSDFEATPFKRIRVHISEASTQKDKGKLVRDITLELGNMERVILMKSKDDLGDVTQKEIHQYLFDLWDNITIEGKKRGKKFIDDDSED